MSLTETIEFEDNGKRYRVVRDVMNWKDDDSIFPVPGTTYIVLSNPIESTDTVAWNGVSRFPSIKRTDKKDLEVLIWQIKYQAKRKIKKWVKEFKAKYFPNSR